MDMDGIMKRMTKSSISGKPMKNPEFFSSHFNMEGKWTTIYYKLANTSTTQHKPMVVWEALSFQELEKFEERLI